MVKRLLCSRGKTDDTVPKLHLSVWPRLRPAVPAYDHSSEAELAVAEHLPDVEVDAVALALRLALDDLEMDL